MWISQEPVFELAVSHHPETITARHRLSLDKFREFLAQLRRATVVMEACGSAHYWALHQGVGHQVVLLPPDQVRPHVLRNKPTARMPRGFPEHAGLSAHARGVQLVSSGGVRACCVHAPAARLRHADVRHIQVLLPRAGREL